MRALFSNEQLRQACIGHVARRGGSRQDGEDVFQEAIILFDRNVRAGRYREEGALEAYFMGIVRWQWFNQRKRDQKHRALPLENLPEQPDGDDPERHFLAEERRERLRTLLEMLSEKCRNILKLWQLEHSMEEVAQALDYANANVAKKEASLCRRRFRVLLEQHPEAWEG